MDNWQSKSLRDVISKTLTVNPRKTPESKFLYVDVSSVSNKTLQIESSEELLGAIAPSRARRVIREGDVIFAMVRPTLRRIAVVPPYLDGEVCSTGYFVFQPTHEIHNRYLFYFLQTEFFMGEMAKLQSGASYPAVNDTQVKSQIIRYPTNIEEQKRIVATLDQAFADLEQARAKTEQNLKNSRELFDSYLQQVFSQIGEGWPLSKLVDTVNIVDSLHKTPKYSDNGYPMVRVTDIKSGELDLSNTRKVDKETYLEFSKRYKANVGDIVFSRVGSYGRSVIVNTNEQFCLGQNTVFLSPRFNGYYFYYFLNSPIAKEQIDKMVSGSTQPTVSLKSIKSILIPIPTEAKQAEIVQQLKIFESKINRLEAIYRQKSNSIDELKKSILQKAFSGELTATAE
jgi:type I restriction enzyme S subunit